MKKVFFAVLLVLGICLTGKAVEPGYRGFVDYGYFVGTGDFDGSTLNEISTTHGYQILPQLFVGGGVEVQLFKFGENDSFCYNLLHSGFF